MVFASLALRIIRNLDVSERKQVGGKARDRNLLLRINKIQVIQYLTRIFVVLVKLALEIFYYLVLEAVVNVVFAQPFLNQF